jgi:hypothetical protein
LQFSLLAEQVQMVQLHSWQLQFGFPQFLLAGLALRLVVVFILTFLVI